MPSIFLANTKNDVKLIVDGYQRIMTICDFIHGTWSGDGSEFSLTNSEKINERWRGKKFSQLSQDDQRKFRMYTIHAIIFEQKSPKNDSGLYQIFERINTSSKTLNPQEIRNCVYQGKLNTLLFELNQYDKWRTLFGSANEDSRMLDIELILRYFTLRDLFYEINDKKGTINLKKSLNDYMSNNVDGEDSHFKDLKDDFTKCVDFICSAFGDSAFHNLTDDLSKLKNKFYPTIFDSLMVATHVALNSDETVSTDNIESRRIELLKNQDYRGCIVQGTMKVESIKRRIEMALEMIRNGNKHFE